MGFRDGAKAGGSGGWLNNVDARIVGYQFVAEEKEIKKGPKKGTTWTPINFIPSFLQEGADEPVSQSLLVANGDTFGEYEISDDGLTLLTKDGQRVFANSDVWAFILSAVEADASGELERRLDETVTDDGYNFEPIIGARVQLIQEVNEEKTTKRGRDMGKDGKGGTSGKGFDRKDLKVSAVHELPAAPKAGKAGKVASKAGKTSKADETARIAEKAEETLVGIVEAAGGAIQKSKLSMAVLKALTKDADREAVRTFLSNDDNLSAFETVTYSAKTGKIETA